MLILFVSDKPTSTISEMMQFLVDAHPGLQISNTCVSDYLDGKLITYKNVRDVPVSRNSEETKEKRKDYARWFIEEGNPNTDLIFVDEVGVNVWTKRQYGRSQTGQRCFQVVGRLRGQNITVCTAISTEGLVHYKTKVGGFNRSDYNDFLGELSQLLLSQDKQFSVIMDNVSFHHNIAALPHNIAIKYLSPTHRFLTPLKHSSVSSRETCANFCLLCLF